MLPIRRILIREQAVTFGAVIVVLVALAWLGLSRSLDHQMQARSQESLTRLNRDLRIYLQEGERLGNTVGRYWREGSLPLKDPSRVQRTILPLMESLPSVANLYILTPRGEGANFQRRPGGVSTWMLSPDGEGHVAAREMAEGWVTALPDSLLDLKDYTQRPWFAQAQTGPHWIGQNPKGAQREISYSVPVRSARGELEAVVCVDIALDALSRRVWETRPTPGSLALVCDASRRALLVPMNAPSPGDDTAGKIFLRPIGPDFLPLFADLLHLWDSHEHAPELIRMRFQGNTYAGRVLPLQGVEGLDWFLCLAVPDRDYLGTSYRLVLVLGLIGLLFLSLAVWRIHHLARRLGDPLAALAKTAKALGEGSLAQPIHTDLTEIQTLSEALQKAGQALQKESEMQLKLEHSQRLETLGTLAGGIAHDVNNQLASVLGQISLAGELLPEGHPGLYRMHRAEQAVERCAQMLKSLLSFSHQVPPELRTIDLNDLVAHTASLLERVLGGLIRTEVIQTPCLPAILGEPVQLEQVILNLAINARDAMPHGGKLTLRTLAVGKSQVCLSVEDTGGGISKDILPQIFDPFFTTKEVGKGTGLGLAMVFGIMQSHGGRIEVDSQEGVGTRFRLFFEAQKTATPKEAPQAKAGRSGHSFAGVRILVAEDEPNLRELLTEAFTQRGAEVDTAPDGELAWRKFQRGTYDLVISDQRMPECTGLELLGRIREGGSQVPMILASGFGLEGLLGELSKDPRLRYLSKPCMIHDFFATAASLLQK